MKRRRGCTCCGTMRFMPYPRSPQGDLCCDCSMFRYYESAGIPGGADCCKRRFAAERFLDPACPIEEVHAELRAAGFDPDDVGKRGAEFVAGLIGKRKTGQ